MGSSFFADVLGMLRLFITVYVWRIVQLGALPSAMSSSLRHFAVNVHALIDIFVLGSTATWSHTARRAPPQAAAAAAGNGGGCVPLHTTVSGSLVVPPTLASVANDASFQSESRFSPMRRLRRLSESAFSSDADDSMGSRGLDDDGDDESQFKSLSLRQRPRRGVALAPSTLLSDDELTHFAYVPPWLPSAVRLPFYRPSKPGPFPAATSSSADRGGVSTAASMGTARLSAAAVGGASPSTLQLHQHRDEADASSSDASSCAEGEIRTARRLPPHVQATLAHAATSDSAVAPVRRPLPCRMPGSKVLVLDLDDTLVCTSTTITRYTVPPTYSEAIPTAAGADLYYVWERPHVALFLQCVSQWYHLVAFTASSQPYADVLLDRLERRVGKGTGRLFRRRLYRSDCTPAPQGGGGVARVAFGGRPDGSCNRGATAPPLQTFWKDLGKVGAPLARTVLLDDTLESFTLQPENGLQCPRYVPPRPTSLLRPAATPMLPVDAAMPSNRDKDRALLDLLPMLEALAHTWDVRPVLAHQIHLSVAKGTKRTTTSIAT